MSQRVYHQWRAMRPGLALFQVVPLCMLQAVAACKKNYAEALAAAPKVEVAKALLQTVPLYLELAGRTDTKANG